MPERDDATQQGITLPPRYARNTVTTDDVLRAIRQHQAECPFAQLEIEPRTRALENRLSLLIGLMLGSGLIGGAAGAGLIKAIAG